MRVLQHPVWTQRIAWVHKAASTVLHMNVARSSASGTCAAAAGADAHSCSSSGGSGYDCRVFLAAWQLLLVVLSLLMAGWLEPVPAPAPALAAAPADAARAAVAEGKPQPGGPGTSGAARRAAPSAARGPLGRCWGWLQRANAEAEGTLRHLNDMLVGAAWPRARRRAAWALTLSSVWVLALILELPQFALPPTPTAAAA